MRYDFIGCIYAIYYIWCIRIISELRVEPRNIVPDTALRCRGFLRYCRIFYNVNTLQIYDLSGLEAALYVRIDMHEVAK